MPVLAAGDSARKLIQITGLTKTYGAGSVAVHALRGIDTTVERGEFLSILGPNGGGKTVAITAVGLSALLLRAGLPVAAGRGSRLPFYPSVRAAVEGASTGARRPRPSTATTRRACRCRVSRG